MQAVPAQTAPRPGCDGWLAEFTAVEGAVELRSGGKSDWISVTTGDFACAGDTVRTGPYAGATLRLQDKTLFRLDQNSLLDLPGPDGDDSTFIDLVRGIIHIISRDPRKLTFRTPYLNAGLEGTEFVIETDADGADVTVIEGIVAVSRGAERIDVLPGERGRAGPTGLPSATSVPDPFDATRWTPFAARILLPVRGIGADAAATTSADTLIARAGERLQYGGFDAAAADLDAATRLAPRHPGIPALRAMIALSRGDKAGAAALAAESIALDSRYVPGRLAHSYVAQAEFDYPLALDAARRADSLAPDNAVTAARVAELALAAGVHREAAQHAARAVALEPAYAHGHAVLGFVRLAESEFDAAIASFAASVARDATSPLPRIGWALAAFRHGDFVGGRDQLELAVILDPANATLRSLMAKVYTEEGRLELAGTQLELAATLDPDDPTALVYRSITEQRAGRPIAAMQAFDSADALNGHEPAFRSELRLDPDTAVRDFGFSHVFSEVGFQDRALRSGWRATANDPRDHSGHRLLSDAYALRPRHELARVYEHYQARLLQPLSQSPLAPQLGEPSIYLVDDLGPSELATTQFVNLVPENGLHLQASAVGAGLETRGFDAAITALHDRLSYGVGHFDFATDGFRANNDLSLRVTSGHVQFQPDAGTNLIAELRHSVSDQGDLQLLFDPAKFIGTLRQSEEIDSLRVGLRRDLAAGTLLVSATASDATMDSTTGAFYTLHAESHAKSLELQHLLSAGDWQITSGIYRQLHNDQEVQSLTVPFPFTSNQASESDEFSAYLYAHRQLTGRLQTTIGLTADRIHFDDATIRETNPKLGLRFDATDKTTIRATLAETTQGRVFSRRSIQPRLEPTHVAGFNQIFAGSRGEHARLTGAAIDHRFSSRLFAGLEVSERDVEFGTFALDFVTGRSYLDFSDRDERVRHLFVNWLPTDRMSLTAAYRRDDFQIDGASRPESFITLDTRRLPIEINYFAGTRLRAGARLSLIRQSGLFTEEGFGDSPITMPDSARFAVLDLSLAYRLPNNRGQLSLSIDNALDADFRFQDIDPENPNMITERVVALRFTIAQ